MSRSAWFFVIGFILLVFSVSFVSSTRSVQTSQLQLTGAEDHSISLADAVKLTKNFRSTAPAGSIYGEYFGKNAIEAIISQAGAVGMSIYYGRKDDGSSVLVLVGVDENDGDLTGGPLAETGFPCPPFCDTVKVFGR
jgi:hypothetical protein